MSDDNRRVQRVQKELNHLIATYLRSEWKGPSPGLLSVAHVDVLPDLRSAKVYISVIVIGKELEGEDVMELTQELLEEQRGDIQHFISRNLRMKYYPKLSFKVGSYGDSPISSPDDIE